MKILITGAAGFVSYRLARRRSFDVGDMALATAGIKTRSLVSGGLLRQKTFADKCHSPESFPTADYLQRRSFFVGGRPLLTQPRIKYICRSIVSLFDL